MNILFIYRDKHFKSNIFKNIYNPVKHGNFLKKIIVN